jgi:hypothetical protein
VAEGALTPSEKVHLLFGRDRDELEQKEAKLIASPEWRDGDSIIGIPWVSPDETGEARTMSRTVFSRLHKLEKRARLDCSLQNLFDAALFDAYQDMVARGGGPDAFAAYLREEGEDAFADAVLAHARCRAAA